jgi:hypothetical protein
VQTTGAVVKKVRGTVTEAPLEMLTGLFPPKLSVGRFCAPLGLEVTAAVSATLPAKPPVDVKVTVDTFPVVAPGVTVTAVPVMVKPGGLVPETVTEVWPEAPA